MLSRIGLGELIILLVVVLLLFGPKRLPELASALGKSIKNFKDGLKDENSDQANASENKQDKAS